MKPDIIRFNNARNALYNAHERFNIGTYKERSQHQILKLYYEPDPIYHEIKVDGHIADIKKDDLIIEIQTSGFKKLIKKLTCFSGNYNVKIVFPCPVKSRICWIDTETGDTTSGIYKKTRSGIYKILPELLHIVGFINDPHISIDIVLTAVSNVKLLDGYGLDKKKRATKIDTIPDEIADIITINSVSDIFDMFSFSENQEITNSDISAITGLNGRKLWMAVKFLTESNILSLVRKEGKKNIYILNSKRKL